MNVLSSTTMRVMPREMRLMSERIFSLCSLPKGFYLAICDFPMYSQKRGLGGFDMLERRFGDFKSADPVRISVVSETSNLIALDAQGEHAWFALPSAIDLLGEIVARHGSAELTVQNAADADELELAADFGGRSGLAITVLGNVLGARLAPAKGGVREDDPLLWALLNEGVEIEANLWWRIYHLAKQALATDSVVFHDDMLGR